MSASDRFLGDFTWVFVLTVIIYVIYLFIDNRRIRAKNAKQLLKDDLERVDAAVDAKPVNQLVSESNSKYLKSLKNK